MTAANIISIKVIDSKTMRFKSDAGEIFELSFESDFRDIIDSAMEKAVALTPKAGAGFFSDDDTNSMGKSITNKEEKMTATETTTQETEDAAEDEDASEDGDTIGEEEEEDTIKELSLGAKQIDLNKYKLDGCEDDEYEDDFCFSQNFLY